MGWVKLDDHFFDNPKTMEVSNPAKLLYLAVLAHCAAHLTDGHFTMTVARRVANTLETNRVRKVIDQLVQTNLWERHSDEAFEVHDYLVYNPSRRQVLHAREQDRKRKFRGGSQTESQRHPTGNPQGVQSESNRESTGNPKGVQPDSKRRVVIPSGLPPTPPPASSRTAGGAGPVPADDDQGDEDGTVLDPETGKRYLAELRGQVTDPPRGLRKAASTTPEPPREPPEPDHSEEPF